MGDFERDTAVEATGENHFRADLSRDWEIWGPNGGYVAAIALRAAGRVARIPRPASFAGHFVSTARFAPVEIAVTPVHLGRRAESLRVALSQNGRAVFEGLLRTAAEGPGLEHDHTKPPDVPDPESLKGAAELREPGTEPPYPFWNNLEARPVHLERFSGPPTPSDPIWLEWYRFRPRATFDDPFVDAGRALLLIDTMSWPAASRPHVDRTWVAPNLDVTAWFHASDPTGEWLLSDHDAPIAEGGLMGTRGRVWSRDRRLLATGGAQLLCVPAGRGA